MITINGEEMAWREGMTVQDAIDAKRFTFRMLAVWIDDSPVPRDQFDVRTIRDGARVQIVHMISGG